MQLRLLYIQYEIYLLDNPYIYVMTQRRKKTVIHPSIHFRIWIIIFVLAEFMSNISLFIFSLWKTSYFMDRMYMPTVNIGIQVYTCIRSYIHNTYWRLGAFGISIGFLEGCVYGVCSRRTYIWRSQKFDVWKICGLWSHTQYKRNNHTLAMNWHTNRFSYNFVVQKRYNGDYTKFCYSTIWSFDQLQWNYSHLCEWQGNGKKKLV